jgi:hypothetical protein
MGKANLAPTLPFRIMISRKKAGAIALLIVGLGAFLFLAPVVPEKILYYDCPNCAGGIPFTPIAHVSVTYFLVSRGAVLVLIPNTSAQYWISTHDCRVADNEWICTPGAS